MLLTFTTASGTLGPNISVRSFLSSALLTFPSLLVSRELKDSMMAFLNSSWDAIAVVLLDVFGSEERRTCLGAERSGLCDGLD